MSVKPNTKISSDPAPKAMGTHAYIQEVQRHRGIPQSIKGILVHCLTKYQAKDKRGNPYTFSVGGILKDTGWGNGTVKTAVAELRKHKVLKEWGTIRFSMNQDKPTTTYLFLLEGLKTYLKEKSGIEMLPKPNKDNTETTIDDLPKTEEKSGVKSGVKSLTDRYKKIVEEDSTKNEEDKMGSTSTPATSTLMEMERQLNDGFGCKSVHPSIVPSPSFKSDKKHFSVPYGIDDKLPSHQITDNKAQTIVRQVFKQEALQWSCTRVSKEVIQKRTDAFNASFTSIKTFEDASRVIKEVSGIK